MALRMQPAQYTGPIWQGPSVHPALWSILQQKDRLVELHAGNPPWRVVIGVPHHAARGTEQIALDWINPLNNKPGRAADETAGLTALAQLAVLEAQGISCRVVIAAHATDHDPNKIQDSPYWQTIFHPPLPRLLLELHGFGRSRRHDLELSAGRNAFARPLPFGERLSELLSEQRHLAVQLYPDTREARAFHLRSAHSARLETPALNTGSLSYAGEIGIPALHLEMKAAFRNPVETIPGGVFPNPSAWELARALATVIEEQFPIP